MEDNGVMNPLRLSSIGLAALLVSQMGGCPSSLNGIVDTLLGSSGSITVVVENDTNFDVLPDMRIDDDDSGFNAFLAGVFGGQELVTGRLAPGEFVNFNFDCDQLGLIYVAGAEQSDLFGAFSDSGSSSILRRDHDYDCGDSIVFQFLGDGDAAFGVVVSVNGLVVD